MFDVLGFCRRVWPKSTDWIYQSIRAWIRLLRRGGRIRRPRLLNRLIVQQSQGTSERAVYNS